MFLERIEMQSALYDFQPNSHTIPISYLIDQTYERHITKEFKMEISPAL